jgi:hypothetical protein
MANWKLPEHAGSLAQFRALETKYKREGRLRQGAWSDFWRLKRLLFTRDGEQ